VGVGVVETLAKDLAEVDFDGEPNGSGQVNSGLAQPLRLS